MNKTGALLVLCGIDGSGKTTQADLLERHLTSVGLEVFMTSEPTSWYLGDPLVRSYFSGQEVDERGLAALALFAAADRARHVAEVILPQLRLGKVVVSSRYVHSTYAYFYGRGLRDHDWLAAINRYAIEPDLVFFLDIAPEEVARRVAKRGDKAKKEEVDIPRLRDIREKYLSFASDTFHVLDGSKSLNEVHSTIVSLVHPVLQRLRG
ncbi:MAG: dTMP kinase [Streptosporangiaceae bacterium]